MFCSVIFTPFDSLIGYCKRRLIFLLLGISVALQRVVLAAVGVPPDGLGYLIAVVVSALLWRPFNVLIDTARFRIGQLL